MWITQNALVEFEKLMPGKHLVDMKKMVQGAAPVTHARGNRRFNTLVFKVHKGQVIDVGLFADTGCDGCGHKGYTMMYDDFLHKQIRIPCDCKAYTS